jgi:hypothetical protein
VRRASILCAIVFAGAASAAYAVTSPPRAVLTGFVCHHDPNPLNREVAVTAVMRPIASTERMALKFELERKASAVEPFTAVSGHDLGKWLYPTDPVTLGQQPGDMWRYDKPVVNLAAGTYRFRVAFRWTGTGGLALGTAVRFSARCDQA